MTDGKIFEYRGWTEGSDGIGGILPGIPAPEMYVGKFCSECARLIDGYCEGPASELNGVRIEPASSHPICENGFEKK